MHGQKNPFKVVLMTLVSIGLTVGVFTLSAQADDRKDDQKFDLDHYACYEVEEQDDKKDDDGRAYDKQDDGEKVVLYNQFEGGTPVYVGELKLLCVPTHKVHYRDDGYKDDDGKDDRR